MQPGYSQDFSHNAGPKGSAQRDDKAVQTSEFLAKVYGWMSFGLFVTAVVSLFMAMRPDLIKYLIVSDLFFGLLIGEVIMVAILSGLINRMSSIVAGMIFLGYSALNGVTLSIIFLIYTSASIASTFVLCAATFGAMSIYGYTTKKDLSSMGSFCYMALFGLIISSFVNAFMQSPAVYWIQSYIGVAVFIGITAWDTQKIKLIAQGELGDEELASKASIIGALQLYLDFVNLFIYLLRIFGRRRD